MRIDDMILVSVDDHVIEPANMFERHIPAKYKDRAPRMVKNDAGDDMWIFEGQLLPNVGLNAVAGRPPEEYGFEPTRLSQMRAGCHDVHARIGDMNANGVLASMCFPSFPSFAGKLFVQTPDKELSLAVLRAYNDWHIHEWAGAYPGRFIPLALLPMWDAKLCADEVRRVAGSAATRSRSRRIPWTSACRASTSRTGSRSGRPAPTRASVLCMHIGTGGAMPFTSPEMPIDASIAATPVSIVNTAADWLFSQVLRDYPGLQLALSEGGIGWIPYFLERCDYVYEHHHAWTHQDFGGGSRATCSASTCSPASSTTPRASRCATRSGFATSAGSATTRTPTRPGRRRPKRWRARWSGFRTTRSISSRTATRCAGSSSTPSSGSAARAARWARCARRQSTSISR